MLIVLDDPSPSPSEHPPGENQNTTTPLINTSQCLLDLDPKPESVPNQDNQSKPALEDHSLSGSEVQLQIFFYFFFSWLFKSFLKKDQRSPVRSGGLVQTRQVCSSGLQRPKLQKIINYRKLERYQNNIWSMNNLHLYCHQTFLYLVHLIEYYLN